MLCTFSKLDAVKIFIFTDPLKRQKDSEIMFCVARLKSVKVVFFVYVLLKWPVLRLSMTADTYELWTTQPLVCLLDSWDL